MGSVLVKGTKMDINRLKTLSGISESDSHEDGYEEIMSELMRLANKISQYGFDDDIAENMQAAIESCMGQIEELLSNVPVADDIEDDYDYDHDPDPYSNMDDRF
jgi:endonuclease IV